MNLGIGIQYPDSLLRLGEISADALDDAMEDMRRVLLRRVKSGTPIDTGRLWESWTATTESGGVSISTDVPYAQYVELGAPPSNWPNVGPRTIDSMGKFWSRQAVGGILAPIVADEEWLNQAVQTVVDAIASELQ